MANSLSQKLVDLAPVKAIPTLLAIKDLAISQSDHRQRVRDSHKAMAHAAGFAVGGEEDMGDIFVCGDIAQNHIPSSTPSGLSSLGKALITAAALLGGGGLGAAAASYFLQPASADSDTLFDLEIVPDDKIAP